MHKTLIALAAVCVGLAYAGAAQAQAPPSYAKHEIGMTSSSASTSAKSDIGAALSAPPASQEASKATGNAFYIRKYDLGAVALAVNHGGGSGGKVAGNDKGGMGTNGDQLSGITKMGRSATQGAPPGMVKMKFYLAPTGDVNAMLKT
jgi:hypothetical protein